jgi:hypothetical protein
MRCVFSIVFDVCSYGEVAEWLKAAACKGCYAGNRIGGSNPSPLRHFHNSVIGELSAIND